MRAVLPHTAHRRRSPPAFGPPGQSQAIPQNVAQITGALRAAGTPNTKFAGMTYYNPFLGQWLNGQGGQETAKGSVSLVNAENAALVEYDLVATDRQHGPYPSGTIWAEPRLDDAARQMVDRLSGSRK